MTRTFNTRMVFRTMGALLLIEAVFMTMALFVSLWYSEADSGVFLLSTIITLLAGVIGLLVGRRAESSPRCPSEGGPRRGPGFP